MKKSILKLFSVLCAVVLLAASFAACAPSETTPTDAATEPKTTTEGSSTDLTVEDIIVDAASEGKVGNWGLGNEYEIQALLQKYEQPITFLSQAFDMNGFDDDSVLLASAMTYNELGLVINDYDGALGYGDDIGVIDMNEEGVAMLQDNLFCTREFAESNPNTVQAFLYATIKGWEYAIENPEEAAEIVFNYGSSVSPEHQAFMASEVKKLVETDMDGNLVTDIGNMDDNAMQQTLELAQTYINLDDAVAQEALQALTLDDIRDASYLAAALASEDGQFGELEQTEVSIQLKWLPQAQFMGYYVALEMGYYEEVGLTVTIVPGGGDISETTAVNSGMVDFGVTWVSNLIAASAGGMDLIEIAQIYQRSGLVLVYKYDNFS